MTEREKVIYSIERCICHVPDACSDCAYDAGHPYPECEYTLLQDVLALLKAQEPLAVRITDDFGAIKFGNCPKCGSIINNHGYPKSCGCGQAVKWDG